jgi:glycosyltransferase involved in cell wall biosynthesis
MVCRRSKIGFPLDKKHDFDLAFWRHYRRVLEAVRLFAPNIIHITGPSDTGQLGALVAGRLGVPLAASWHTNLHEYAERRALGLLGALPQGTQERAGEAIRRGSLTAILQFYRLARVLFAPNPELIDLLSRGTGKPVHPMNRGVDTDLFKPSRRDRSDETFTVGYVGRLTTEKNIRFLAELEQAMEKSGLSNFCFSIVGQGAEEDWLRTRMRRATFHGVLKGEALARAYANMDVFVFPSRTDTFGNVVLEALASGVPAIVTDAGGPRFIVEHQKTGFVAATLNDFVVHLKNVAGRADELRAMGERAQESAMRFSWDLIFSGMYEQYARELQRSAEAMKNIGLGARPNEATSG